MSHKVATPVGQLDDLLPGYSVVFPLPTPLTKVRTWVFLDQARYVSVRLEPMAGFSLGDKMDPLHQLRYSIGLPSLYPLVWVGLAGWPRARACLPTPHAKALIAQSLHTMVMLS